MASIIGGSIQTLFAAVSFSAAGFLFKSLDKNGYEAEIKRHNKALEDLTKAKEAKKEVKKYKYNVCSECEIEYECINDMFVCVHCGEVGDYKSVPEWVDNIWLNRKKSQYQK